VSTTEPFLAFCPKCNGDKRAEIVAAVDESYSDDNYSCLTKHRIIKCQGCGHLHFQTEFTDSEDLDYGYDESGEEYCEPVKKIEYYPPKPKRDRPSYAHSHPTYSFDLERLLDEAYKALDNDLNIVAAIGLRTAFDASTEILGIDPNKKFFQKLNELETLGHISKNEHAALSALTDAGNAAAHRGWCPTAEQLDTMFSIFEAYLYRAFVMSKEQNELLKRAKKLAKTTPKRKRLRILPKPQTT
jgi:Domain of unknown function (DUF4145)